MNALLGGVITVSGAKFMGQILYVDDQMQKTYDKSDKNTKHENGLKSSHVKKETLTAPQITHYRQPHVYVCTNI